MAKKKKRKIQAPSLSALDKVIYFLLMACSCAAGLFLYPAIIGNVRGSVFQDTRILAQSNQSTVIFVFLGFAFGGGLALVFNWLRCKKQPIFGKASIKYGSPQWKPVYPVFSKQFWKEVFSRKKHLCTVLLVMLLVIAIVLIITSLGLSPRECLFDDGSVQVYNCFNENTMMYTASDVEQVRICTRDFHNRRGPYKWAIELQMTMEDGETFFFPYNDFQTRDENIDGAISGMYHIKSCFDPGIIILEGKQNIPYVIRDMFLNQQEIDMLSLLFELD